MSTKSLVWMGMAVGSTVGSFVPYLWGGDSSIFSISSLFWSSVFAVLGIWAAYKLGERIN